jgi:hypothetical protein
MFWTRKVATGFVFLLALKFPVRADITAYMVTGQSQFGTIDLNTGAFTQIGPNEVVQVSGLGESTVTTFGSTLYASSYQNPAGILYSVNTTDGLLTPVSAGSGVDYVDFGSTLTGLYAVDNLSNLWSVNPTTGAATMVGSLGIGLGGYQNLSTNSSTLYFADSSNIYTVNTTTGHATLLGPTGGYEFGALITEGSVLYGGQDFLCCGVDTIDATNGSPITGPFLTGTTSNFFGLAPVPATTTIPEPANVSWLLVGLLAAGGWVRKQRAP